MKILNHLLTDAEHCTFARDGYMVIQNALSPQEVTTFLAIVDEIDARKRAEQGLSPYDRVNLHDTIGHDNRLLDLIDWPTTFAKVWGIMGYPIQLYHTQMIVTPPPEPEMSSENEIPQKRLGWHQDNNRMGKDLDLLREPQPMVSLKVAYFLTDTTRVGSGNFYVVPGSHQQNRLHWPINEKPMNGKEEPLNAIPTQVKAGDAIIFDRRLWHAASPNTLDTPRKVLFYGYSYRWLRPKCDMATEPLLNQVNPIRRQLLGWATSANGRYDPKPEDVPLRAWIAEHVGEEAVVPWDHTLEERGGRITDG
ncbi:MAG: phytanoyl-CoA dioxygenase family protein [Chloroflexota bacterium]